MGGLCGAPATAEEQSQEQIEQQVEEKVEPEEEKSPRKKKVKKRSPRGNGTDPDFPFVDGEHNVNHLWDYFEKKKVLGQGASCEVAAVIRKEDGHEFACKIMRRDDKWNPILFKQEVELLGSLDHPNILKYRDCYMDKRNFYVCTELCKGGELFDRIKELKKFTERQAAGILRTIVDAIAHCHDKDIVHRDLKPENIVYASKAQKELVIIDFGDAKKIKEDAVYEDFVGTAFYLAPECVRNRYGWELKKSDMWTIGVIAYVLLTGRPPFYGRGNKDILKKIIRCKVTFPPTCKLSMQAMDFILGLIQKDPKERLSARQALKHDWLQGHDEGNEISKEVLSNLGNYSASCKLKKVLVRLLANQMTEEDHDKLASQFKEMDKDGNGLIDLGELQQFIERTTNLNRKEAGRRASQLMEQLDQDGDGQISLEEFADARLSTQLHQEDVIKKHFDHIDADGNGFISSEELGLLFNWTLSKELIAAMISEVDTNNDGKISFDEFKTAMMKGSLQGGGVLSPRQPAKAELTDRLRKEFAEEGAM